MKAAVLVADRRIEMRDLPDPEPGPGEVLIAPAFASICGTDEHVFAGEFAGRVRHPLVQGHEFSGTVAAVGAGVEEPRPGERVTVDPIVPCLRCPACRFGRMSACRQLKLLGVDLPGAFATRVVASAASCFTVPAELSLRNAALTEVYAIGCHATRRAQVDPGDVVVVLGAGKLGLCVLENVRRTAARLVVVTDLVPERLERAREFGADVVIDVSCEDPVARVLDLTAGAGADRVLEAVGHARLVGPNPTEPMTQAAQMIRPAGRVVVLGQGPVPAPILFKPFVWKEAEIIASRVTLGEVPRALAMLAEGRFHPDRLITHQVSLERAAEAYAILADPTQRAVKLLLEIEPPPEAA
jgi:2-desacetyl-2-hydroxyethyl bacteriochlorophyllide A dehydrogenase